MLPKNLSDILLKKDQLLMKQQALLDKALLSYQNDVLTSMINTLYGKLDVVNGVIQDTLNNYQVLSQIDRTLSEVEKMNVEQISGRISKATSKSAELSNTYFRIALTGQSLEKLNNIAVNASKKMGLRLGYVEDRLVRGGYLDNLLNIEDLKAQAFNLINKYLATQAPIKDLVKELSTLINGEKEGFIERKYRNLAHDLYMQYDAAYNNTLAKAYEMNYFVYQNGLVDDSRDFCIEHNGYVYHRDILETWSTWTPAKAIHLTEIKQKDINKIPSYLDYAGYDPVIDRGGYNCRHILGWISDELAFELAPELKNKI
jgi:hypothetical protein